MAKKFRVFTAILLTTAVLSSLLLFGAVRCFSVGDSSYEQNSEQFISDLTAIYARYDTDLDTLDESDTFALKRILVTEGFDGDLFGAAAYAYDKGNDFAVLQYETEEDAKSALDAMLKSGMTAEPDGIARLDASGKCTFDAVSSETLGVPSYLDNYYMGYDDVIVAVLDTGVMYDYPAIADRFYSKGIDLSPDESEDAYYDTEMQGMYFGHATFVSGIIADNTSDNVKIQPYKLVAHGASAASGSAIVAGINAAVSLGADVINISLSTPGSVTSLTNAVRNAVQKGVCVCVSAGNNAREVDAYPALCPDSITVSAADGTELADFSNYGDCIDFTAPGVRIRSTYPSEDGPKFIRWSGTSFSAPYIAALCADLKSIDNRLSKQEIYDTLCDFAVDLGDEGYDSSFGNGEPNLGDMVYTDNESYACRIPQGTLQIYQSKNYTADTQPWKRFAEKLVSASVDEDVESIGSYTFYKMENAEFTMADTYNCIGEAAFYGCQKLNSFAFGTDVEQIGGDAFGGINDFMINGYRNTPAEEYALTENIPFNVLGCKHNYITEIYEANDSRDGYSEYTCTVCGETYVGPYITPATVLEGRCGENVTFVLDDIGRLTIDGNGEMFDYFEEQAPWFEYRNSISILEIRQGVSFVSPFAFYGCNSIVKIRCSENDALTSDGLSLINLQTGELILTAAKGRYEMPDEVKHLSAPTFIIAGNIAVEPNSRFTVDSGIIYDKSGNIAAVLPSYRETVFTIDRNITIAEYAFMLTKYPSIIDTKQLSVSFEPHCIGFYYDGKMTQTDLSFKVCDGSTAVDYAEKYGFMIDGYDIGKCGDSLMWRCRENSGVLTISGSGDMYVYSAVTEVPWSGYLTDVSEIVIDDSVTSLSPYAFYNAKNLTCLTIPLSVKAPRDNTTWYGCTNLTSLTMTYGNGVMDDYVDEEGNELFTFTPWNLSRTKITSFRLDERVKYIGVQAFRNFTALTELTLTDCDKIAENAFLSCSKFKKLTIYNKATEIEDYSLFSYRAGTTQGIYKNAVIYAYDDSTGRDYCDKFTNVAFVSLGCSHSRKVELVGEETDENGEIIRRYCCGDCGAVFCEYLSHTVAMIVNTTNGIPLADAAVSIGEYAPVLTDSDGTFTASIAAKGTYPITITVHDTVLFEEEIVLEKTLTSGEITLRYADYVKDGVINAKDYAFALKHHFDDAPLFDYGIIEDGDNEITYD